ncbi:heparan-alpha-glucosaminide N-acetyltransferase [Bosea sp. Root381]|uniref:DUF1624 domain-containing protein n=1 Tax=Bosea sp. Root381 TaxID=1736524 RepID=UPI000A83C184|nr:heparan-alpha-glucosaminide N-acetyltransferase [Bosea sp. Root381]
MSDASALAGLPPSRSRFDIVDLARGLALLAMFVFHFAYDLSSLRLIDFDVQSEPGWRWFARLIAGSFLTLVGVSLVLATRNSLNRHAYLKRLVMVAAAAGAVTLATFFFMPQSFIFFGILHQIALASVLALPFLRLPTLAVAVAALIVFAMPALVAHPVLDQPALLWLGLSRVPVVTADYVPVFPWFGCVLLGIVLARLALPRLESSRLATWRPRGLPARIMVWGGRHSLLVYLVHQPVFIATLSLVAFLVPAPVKEGNAFQIMCERSCTAQAAADFCARACACTVETLKREQLLSRAVGNALTPSETQRLSEIARSCSPAR